MVKHTQTIRRQFANELFEFVFDHFVGLALKGLNKDLSVKLQKNKSHNVSQNNCSSKSESIKKMW